MIDFTQVRAFKSRPRLRNSYEKKTWSKKEGRIRGYVYLVSRCTLFILTASFLFTNVLFTNIRNDTPDTTTYTTNTVGNPKSINHDNQLKQLSNSSIYTYTTIKRKLLIQAGTETNPGPTIISLLSPITREKEDSKFITVYCRDGLKTLNFCFYMSCFIFLLPKYYFTGLWSWDTLKCWYPIIRRVCAHMWAGEKY